MLSHVCIYVCIAKTPVKHVCPPWVVIPSATLAITSANITATNQVVLPSTTYNNGNNICQLAYNIKHHLQCGFAMYHTNMAITSAISHGNKICHSKLGNNICQGNTLILLHTWLIICHKIYQNLSYVQ